jgi:hypothetical protein
MRAHTSIVVGVVLSLLFWVLPAHAAPFAWIARRASGLVAAGPQAPTEIGRHRTKLPNGSVYDYDYSFPATLRILRPDGQEQLDEATCYVKADKTDKKLPPSKPSPTKEEWETGVCIAALGGTVAITCSNLSSICVAGGALVFPEFCGGVWVGCGVAELGVAGLIGAGICKPPAPPASAPPPSSQLFWDIAPGSDRAPQFTPAGGEVDAIPDGESWWDFLQETIQQSIDQDVGGGD